MSARDPETKHVYFGNSPGLVAKIQAIADGERRSFSLMTCLLAEEAIKAREEKADEAA